MAKSEFRIQHAFEKRQTEAARIREKYPDRIPVIVEKADRTDISDIDKRKLVSCPGRYNCRAASLCRPQKAKAKSREGYVHIRQEQFTSYWRLDVCDIRRKQGRGWLSLHDLQRREFLWICLLT